MISVIVPIYNVAPFIIACLDSIASQTYSNMEVLFVDDCGTDNSMQLLKEYLETHDFPPYRILAHEYNRGLSAARNTGLQAAQGEYVYFLDSDDELYPDTLAVLAAPLSEQKYEVVVGSIEEWCDDDIPASFLLSEGSISAPLQAYAAGWWYVMAWNKLCRRDFILGNHLFFKEGLLHEDVIWSFQVACLCTSMYLSSQLTYKYKIRSASIMTSLSIEKDLQIYLQAFEEIQQFVLQKGLISNRFVYQFIEGKKCGILYSLLYNAEYHLYKKYYPMFYRQCYLSPWKAFRVGIVNLAYFVRDFHYCLPIPLGALWKYLFYLVYYKLRNKSIQGLVWK